MGAQFLRRRKSTLTDGAGDDARDLSDHLTLISTAASAKKCPQIFDCSQY
jgi:putative flavoprotein involved in K+ transport